MTVAPPLAAVAPTVTPLAARRGFITLDDEAWAAIRSEYLAGATGKQIAEKWGCSRVSVYDHASRGGWTKTAMGRAVSASVLEDVRAEREALAAEAAAPPPEASPLLAAGLLLRQAAAAALLGRSEAAFTGLKLAESLARGARLLSEAEHGIAAERAQLLAEAKEALEDDPDYTPVGWRDGEEARALRDDILAGFSRMRVKRGRAPPDRLPMWFMLEDDDARRPLAEALGLVVEGRNWIECPDFQAAVARARAEGRGEAVDAALSTPVPLERCTWLTAEEKQAVAAREAETVRLADAAAAEVESGVGWVDDEPAGEVAAAASSPGLHHGDDPWPHLRRPHPVRLSEPALAISDSAWPPSPSPLACLEGACPPSDP